MCAALCRVVRASVLFDDGSTEVAWQLKAMEYGATLDAVSLLAQPICMRQLCGGGAAGGGACARPVLILQVDQFGVLHAPFAPARSFLHEHRHDGVTIAVHGDGKGSGSEGPSSENAEEESKELAVFFVSPSDLVPDSPQHMFDGDEDGAVPAPPAHSCC